MDDKTQTIIAKLFAGTKIDESQQKLILGIYLINVYKAILELLITLKANDAGFQDRLAKFLNTEVQSLDNEQHKAYEETLEQQKAQILAKMVNFYKDNLPEEKDKINSNQQQLRP